MADLTITPANVVPGQNAVLEHGVAGEPITAGKDVYKSTVTGKIMLADTNSVTVEARRSRGIAVNGASLNQPVTVQKSGDLALGAVLTIGTSYFGSDTPGGICPQADVGAGEAVCLLGIAKTTSVLSLDIQYPGVTL